MSATYVPIRRTQKETTEAVNRYARRHNCHPKTVRGGTMTFLAAMLEDEVKRRCISLEDARKVFIARYPGTKNAGPMHVSHWIK